MVSAVYHQHLGRNRTSGLGEQEHRGISHLGRHDQRQTQLVYITLEVREAVAGEHGTAVVVYVPHTTAGVTINEHADPAVARDFETALERIVPADWAWQHVEEGEENAPTHIPASFMGTSVLIPLREDGTLSLGTWQGIFFCEFDGPRERSVVVTVLA